MFLRKGIIVSLLLANASTIFAQQMLHVPVNGTVQTVPVSTGAAVEKSSHAKLTHRVRVVRGNFVALGPTEDCSEQRAVLQAAVPYRIATCAAWAFRLNTRSGALTLVDFSLSTADETDVSYGPTRGPIPFGLFDPIEDELSYLNDGEALSGKVNYISIPTDNGSLNVIQYFEKK